jgi:hypothetical protein
MKYRIGQKVVYIGPDFRNHPIAVSRNITVPVPLGVYTVRGSMILTDGPNIGLPGYYFEEYKNESGRDPISGFTCEAAAVDEPFLRPVTDISRFQELRKDIEAGNCDLVRDKVRA